jgi:hypothetical protein
MVEQRAILILVGASAMLLAALPSSPRASAQVGERGRISTRSDVKMSIEGVSGTSGKKLDALAKTLGTPLGTIKQCYGELVKEHPEVVGTLAVELELPASGKLEVRAPGAVRELKPMQTCVDRAFAKLDVSAVPRPAGARVSLALTNSAASSVGEVRKLEESAAKVAVDEQPNGAFRSRGESTQGELSFEVEARERTAVEQAHKLVRDALPGLFDCRRRATKTGSPAGEIALSLSAKGAIKVNASSVANERAPTCVSSVLKRTLGKTKANADVKIRFAP